MDPPASDETLAQSLNGPFHVKYPDFEEGYDCEEGSLKDLGPRFYAEENCGHGKRATKKRRRRKRQSRRDLRLARRTSKILSNYRNFLLEHERDSLMHAASDPLDDGSRESHYDAQETKNPTSSDLGSEEATCPASPDDSLGLSDDGPAEKEYETTVLYSWRVKYGILMGFGVPIILAVVIIAFAGSYEVATPAREDTSGWHSEAGYILEREDEDMVGDLQHHSITVPWKKALQKDDLEDTSSEKETDLKADATETEAMRAIPSPVETNEEPETKLITAEPEETIGEEATANIASKDTEVKSVAADPNAVANFDLEKILHRKFKPLWLNSRQGWTGGSHDEAARFCQSIRGKELCPYSAMCPYGPGKNVMAGRHPVNFSSQGEQYAPVYGQANRWIMVGQKNGDASTTCMSHEQLEGGPPSWGLSGDQAEVKWHIMCCSVPKE